MAMSVAVAIVFTACGCRTVDSQETHERVQPTGARPAVEAPQNRVEAEKSLDVPATKSVPEHTGPKLALTQKSVTLKWVEKGQLRMSATAKEFRGNEVTKTGELIDFAATLYEEGKPATTMSAPRVVADTVKRVVTATGGVKLKSLTRNTTVNSEWITWYAKEHKLIGNGGVTIRSDVWNVEAAAFVADTALKTLSVRSSAKGL